MAMLIMPVSRAPDARGRAVGPRRPAEVEVPGRRGQPDRAAVVVDRRPPSGEIGRRGVPVEAHGSNPGRASRQKRSG